MVWEISRIEALISSLPAATDSIRPLARSAFWRATAWAVMPNSCLAPLWLPPYYAFKIVPGDLGTKGGMVTDPNARALTPAGAVIPGLYAAGNSSAAVMGHSYAGAGATIGPAMTFGYIAALDLARELPAT